MTDDTERLFTEADVCRIANYARLEGSPTLIREIIADLDERGRLSVSPTDPLPGTEKP